jgi:hypothetical protein
MKNLFFFEIFNFFFKNSKRPFFFLIFFFNAIGGSLASDDLYLLDLRGTEDTGIWSVVPVVGTTPGRRYGHSLTYAKPFLVVFGGNTGNRIILIKI